MFGGEDPNEENRMGAVESKSEVAEAPVVLYSKFEGYTNHP